MYKVLRAKVPLASPLPPWLGWRPEPAPPRWSAALLLPPQQSSAWQTWPWRFSQSRTRRWLWWTGSSPPCTETQAWLTDYKLTISLQSKMSEDRPDHHAVGFLRHGEDVRFHVSHVLATVGVDDFLSVYGQLVIGVNGHQHDTWREGRKGLRNVTWTTRL